MPVKTRSTIRKELAEAMELFNDIAVRPTTGDGDVDCKIMFLAMLRRQELFRAVFVQQPEFEAEVRSICVEALRCARRQELRSICRRVLETFWPQEKKAKAKAKADPIAAAAAKVRAEVAARAEARAAEIRIVEFKKLLLRGESAVNEICTLAKADSELFSGFFQANPVEQLLCRNLCWSALMNPLTPLATRTSFAELLQLFWPGASAVTEDDKSTVCQLLMTRLTGMLEDWMGFILDNQRVFHCIFLEDAAFSEQILSAVIAAPPSPTKMMLLQLMMN